ncbi:calcium-binding protein [Taklimakanibacter lacteus]|uniref:calcium-binding protein n=1 Tax=Taklimakanibacter lacteus TaxID=2268456 RepID=UPI000E661F01
MLVLGTPTEGHDWLIGDEAPDFIGGWGGDDLIMGGGGDDLLLGNHGNDIIVPGAGLDSIWGGFLTVDSGSDTVSYVFYGSGVFASLELGYGYEMSAGMADKDTYHGFENLSGSSHSDILVGDGGANRLYGNGGDDWIVGRAGADTMSGGTGNDFLHGGAGGDNLDGGSGIDTITYSDSASHVLVNLASGTGLYGDAQGDVIEEVENVQGSGYDDTLIGNSGANRLMGLNGSDTLNGSGGDDRLEGGNGADTLNGGANNDTLIGGANRDVMTGGSGADKFAYFSTSETGIGPSARDLITDFSRAQGDKIDLSGIDANVNLAGNQAFVFIGDDGFNDVAGELHYGHDDGNTIISGDTDGDGNSDFRIEVAGIFDPIASDFVL